MKRLLAIILSIMAFAGCGQVFSKDGRQGSRAQIKAVVKAVYSDPDAKGLEAGYCSQDYLDVFRQVQAIDDSLAQEGYIGYFDYNHWTGAQDKSESSFRLKSINANGEDYATAIVHVHNCRTVTKVQLNLVRENGAWKIDDLCMDGRSEKTRMKEFITETI